MWSGPCLLHHSCSNLCIEQPAVYGPAGATNEISVNEANQVADKLWMKMFDQDMLVERMR